MKRAAASPLILLVLGGCAVETANLRLHNRSLQLLAQPQAVIRSDFGSSVPESPALTAPEPLAPGSALLRDALLVDPTLRTFVTQHGTPDGIVVTNQTLQIELMYAGEGTAYIFERGHWSTTTLAGTRPLTYVEQTAINPEAHWRRTANDLRIYLDDSARLLRITRRLLRTVPAEGMPARDVGFFVVEANPASAMLLGHPEDTRGVIVAYVDPDGPAARLLQRGDVVTAVGAQPIVRTSDYTLDDWTTREGPLFFTRRRGEDEAVVETTPEPLAFGLDIHVLNTWEVNAFTMPGLIIATTGLLHFCDDDELAFVIGHELGHLAEKQEGDEREQQAMRKGAIAAGVIEPFDPAKLLQRLREKGLLRLGTPVQDPEGAELSADRRGIEYAARAGYDPAGAVRFLEKLKPRDDVHRAAAFAKMHPPADERIVQARTLAQQLQQVESTDQPELRQLPFAEVTE